ncbi:MAG: uracil-DNA glycosylase [Cyclobacteriaceae bacterium]|nr:uracil-DNA glycosylase [Cyclobacteriaceae bacterium]
MDVSIEAGWKEKLKGEFEKPYFIELVSFVKEEYANHVVYPPGKNIFTAFDHCTFENLKVVIIGQDPYHGPGQANGLCFSVATGMKMPPSLVNIFKERRNDLGLEIPVDGNLSRWAKQGVLLLNATLTVRAHAPASHQKKGWEDFTDEVIRTVSKEKESVVFILWGAFAQKKEELIDSSKHHILKSAHPSPFSANRGFFGCAHFSRTNKYLREKNLSEINW